jgi:hypothetical protein
MGTILIPIAEAEQMRMVLQATTTCNFQPGAVLPVIIIEPLSLVIIYKSFLTWFASLGILPLLVECYYQGVINYYRLQY